MADISDVENALLGLLITTVYPDGKAAASIVGSPVRLYRGWPVTMSLGADIAAGMANVSVFPVPGGTRNTTRWGVQSCIQIGTTRLTVSVDGDTAIFGGSAIAGQLAGILVDNVAFVYTVQPGDSPALVAANLYGLVVTTRPCQFSGTSLTVPGAAHFIARTTTPASGIQEWNRQQQAFRISVWAPSPSLRDALCSVIGSALAPIVFLTLEDGTGGRLRYRSTASIDDDRDASVYRRDLIYDVEFPTTTNIVLPTMLFGDLVLNGASIFA